MLLVWGVNIPWAQKAMTSHQTHCSLTHFLAGSTWLRGYLSRNGLKPWACFKKSQALPLRCAQWSLLYLRRMLWFLTGLWGHSKGRLFQRQRSVSLSPCGYCEVSKDTTMCVWSTSIWSAALSPGWPSGALNCCHKSLVAALSRFVLKQAWKQNCTLFFGSESESWCAYISVDPKPNRMFNAASRN